MTDNDLQKEYQDIISEFKNGALKCNFKQITEPCIAMLRQNGYSVYRHRIAAIKWAMWCDARETYTVYRLNNR